MSGLKLQSLVLVITILLCIGPASAQYTTASLGGTVTDASGAVIPGAKVTARNTGTGLTQATSTGSDGAYLFPVLPVGAYSLTVEKQGFRTYVQRGIILTLNEAAAQRVVLQIGEVSQQVTVSANATMLNTHTATTSQLVNQEQIIQLPLNGREAQSLVFLSPGTVNTTNNYCGYNCQGGVYPGAQEASVNGGETANVNYMMDGIDHNDTYINMNLPFPNPDAIQEFNVQLNNMSAVYGGSGNVVNIITKSGTNEFHGDAFEFVRNGNLNARNFFAPTHDTLKRNQFGGTIGGPIKKDKLFFFGTYQGTRLVQAAASQNYFVPTQAERNGDFSALTTQLKNPVTGVPFPGNQIPPSLFSAPANYFLQKIPLPNGPNGLVTFLGPALRQPEDQWMAKSDYSRGKNQLSARYFFTNFNEPADIAAANTNFLAADSNGNRERVQTLALNDTYSFSPTLLANTWFGWDHETGGTVSGTNFGYPDAGVKIVPDPGVVDIPTLRVDGYWNVGGGWPGEFDRGDWRFREVLTQQRGDHEFSFGGELFHYGTPEDNTYVNGGLFRFTNQLSGNNLADFLLGQATSFYQNAPFKYKYQGVEGNLFAQDNWRVNRKLSLNLGVRWDPYWPFQEANNQLECYRPGEGPSQRFPNAPLGLLYAGDPGCPLGGTYSNLDNFAPRLGFAYRMGHNTVLRGGTGVYFTTPQTSQANGKATNAPFAPAFTLNDVSFADPWGSAGIPDPFPAAPPSSNVKFVLPVTLGGFPNDFHVSTMGTWNLMVEHQFGSNWLASITYAGNAGWYLSSNQEGSIQENPAVYIPGNGPNGQPLSTIANTQARRINPNFGSVGLYASSYNSRYEALQLNLEKRFSHGVSILANYTWAKNMDNFPYNDGSGTDPFDRNYDWGVSLDNIPNIFHLSEVYQVPHFDLHGFSSALLNGWQISSITTWQNGFPFTIVSGLDNSFTGNGNDRANFTGTSLSQAVLSGGRPHAQLINEFFNTSLFVPNAIGTFGNAGKNILQGPGLFNTDLAAVKDTHITEGTYVEFRAEFFNVFNNVNFNNPGVQVGTPGFGKITSAGSPRILQFALKFIF